MFSNIGVVGAGAMGTAISQTICDNARNVLLYARREEVVNSINKTHFNRDYFPNIRLQDNIMAINDLNELENAEVIFLTLPSSTIREIARKLKDIISDDCVIVSTAKGLEKESKKRMSVIVEEEIGRPAAVLSGPNIASEMVERTFSSASIACKNKQYLEKVKNVLSTSKFKVSASGDVVGVEYCGVIKNVIAISQGICEGMKINDNARFSVFTKTYNETKDLIEKFGGERSTVDDYCGFGDIITASTLNVSRNHTLGVLYGQKIVIDEKASGVLFEGKNTIVIMKELCEKYDIECATVDFTYDVIIDRINPKKLLKNFGINYDGLMLMICAAILAGGIGSRLKQGIPKQFVNINNKPILVHSVEKFLNVKDFDKIIVSSPKECIDKTKKLMEEYFNQNDKIIVIEGGLTRNGTILNSIRYMKNQNCENDSILVTHDASRIFVSEKLISDSIKYAKEVGAASAVIPAIDVIFESREEGKLTSIPLRKYLYHAQTPQSFNIDKFLEVYEDLSKEEIAKLDEAMIIFHLRNLEVKLFPGDPTNFKITRPFDITLAEAIFKD